MQITGRVISIYGTVYIVEFINNQIPALKYKKKYIISCKMAGKLRLLKKEQKHPIAIGDWVQFEIDLDSHKSDLLKYPDSTSKSNAQILPKGYVTELITLESSTPTIEKICKRQNQIGRQDSHIIQIFGVNLDKVLIISSYLSPPFKWNFLFRLIASCVSENVTVHVFINKTDLILDKLNRDKSKSAKEIIKLIKKIYDKKTSITNNRSLKKKIKKIKNKIKMAEDMNSSNAKNISSQFAIELIIFFEKLLLISEFICFYLISAKDKKIKSFSIEAKNSFSLLLGQSGVGKSTIINTITQDKVTLKTKEVSGSHDKGRHTTTTSVCIPLNNLDAYLVDTPGIKSWGILHLDEKDLLNSFPPLAKLSQKCAFTDCQHQEKSSGCAIWKMAKEDNMTRWLFKSYRSFIKSQKNPLKTRKGDYWKKA